MGFYSAPALPPGEYEVRAEGQGFRTLVRDATVVTGGNTTVDMNMTLGEARQVVSVEAATAQVNYESNTVQGVIERQTIQDLPLNGRSALQLASLEPGVSIQPGSTSQFNAIVNISVFGDNAGATAGSGVGILMTADGGTINDEMEGGTSLNLSQEVVQEFQLSQNTFDLSTGIGASGALNIVTRSGTNGLHGSGYFFFRDHNMAAYPLLARNPLKSQNQRDRVLAALLFCQLRAFEPDSGDARAGGSAVTPSPERCLRQSVSLQSVYRPVRLPNFNEEYIIRPLYA